MNRADAASNDLGQCRHCRGRVAATHMLTKTYPLDADGRWERRFDDFIEDVVVVCVDCGAEPEGTFDAAEGEFMFVSARAGGE